MRIRYGVLLMMGLCLFACSDKEQEKLLLQSVIESDIRAMLAIQNNTISFVQQINSLLYDDAKALFRPIGGEMKEMLELVDKAQDNVNDKRSLLREETQPDALGEIQAVEYLIASVGDNLFRNLRQFLTDKQLLYQLREEEVNTLCKNMKWEVENIVASPSKPEDISPAYYDLWLVKRKLDLAQIEQFFVLQLGSMMTYCGYTLTNSARILPFKSMDESVATFEAIVVGQIDLSPNSNKLISMSINGQYYEVIDSLYTHFSTDNAPTELEIICTYWNDITDEEMSTKTWFLGNYWKERN